MLLLLQFTVLLVLHLWAKTHRPISQSSHIWLWRLPFPTLLVCVYDAWAPCALNAGHCVNTVPSVSVWTHKHTILRPITGRRHHHWLHQLVTLVSEAGGCINLHVRKTNELFKANMCPKDSINNFLFKQGRHCIKVQSIFVWLGSKSLLKKHHHKWFESLVEADLTVHCAPIKHKPWIAMCISQAPELKLLLFRLNNDR